MLKEEHTFGISVIVPVYNSEKYLCACLDSILLQTFHDFELILVDDGSSDRSGIICDKYAVKDDRVVVIHQCNAGQAEARNAGVAAAKSSLLCFIDSDDVVHPFLLDYLYRGFAENNAGATMCGRIREKEVPVDFFDPVDYTIESMDIEERKLRELYETNASIYWTPFPCLIKKSIYEQYPLTPGRVMEDNAVACKWLVAAKRVAFIRASLYFYRENPDSTMSAAFSPKKLDFLWALEEQLSFYKSIGYSTMQRLIWNEYFETAVWFFNRIMTELRDPALAKSVISRTKRIQKEFGFPLSEAQRQKLLKTVHPLLHKINKHLKNHGISICK